MGEYLGYVGALIADALHVGDELERRGYGAQVGRHGLLAQQYAHALTLYRQFQFIGDVVAGADVVGEFAVAGAQRFHRALYLAYHEVAHRDQLVGQFVHFALKLVAHE